MSTGTDWVISLLSGGRYDDDFIEFAVYPWISFPYYIVNYIIFVNITLGEQRRNNAIALGLLIGIVIGQIALTPMFEALGAIGARFVSNVVGAGVALYTVRHVIETQPRLELLVRAGLLFAGGVLATWLLLSHTSTILAFTLAIPIFGILLVATRVLRQPDIELFRSIFGSILRKLRPSRGS